MSTPIQMLISVVDFLTRGQQLEREDCFFTLNGRPIDASIDKKCLEEGDYLEVHYRGRGGKGGFGSMLRAIGNQIEKTTNREMCRDLSGRRMRDVNAEERLKEWYSKASERERKKVEQYLEKQRKRKETLTRGPLYDHKFEDPEFQRRKEQISAQLQDAVETAIEKLAAESKESSGPSMPSKRSRLWIEGLDYDSSISSSSDEDNENDIAAEEELAEILGLIVDSKSTEETGEGPSTSSGSVDERAREELKSDGIKSQAVEQEAVPEKAVTSGLSDEALSSIESVDQLEEMGLDCLKQCLVDRGLKCGGTVKERASRLFSIRHLSRDEYPAKLKAAPAKQAK